MKSEFKTGFAVGLGVLAAIFIGSLAMNWVNPMLNRGNGGGY